MAALAGNVGGDFFDHEMQILRQRFMTELQQNAETKKEAMQAEAEAGKRSEQTFQHWFGDQILMSANYFSHKFVEEVLSYSMKQLQR